jgi:hypothetical protein
VDAYKSGKGPIFDAVNCLGAAEKKNFRNAANSQFPSMSAIDRAVRNSDVQAAVWMHFSFVPSVEYPVLSNDLLYGTLSAGVHTKVFKHILVSDEADDSYKKFIRELASYFRRTVVEYSEVDASTYEDNQAGKQANGDGDSDSDGDGDGDIDKKGKLLVGAMVVQFSVPSPKYPCYT